MSSSSTCSTSLLVCSICNEHLHSLVSLHHHQMSYHTAKELSLALILLERSERTTEEMESRQVLENGSFADLVCAQLSSQANIPTRSGVTVVSPQNARVELNYVDGTDSNMETAQNNKVRDTDEIKVSVNTVNGIENNVEMCSQSKTEARDLNQLYQRNNGCKKNPYLHTETEELSTSTCSNLKKYDMTPQDINNFLNNDIDDKKSVTESNVELSNNANEDDGKENHEAGNIPRNYNIVNRNTYQYVDNSDEVMVLDMECVDDLECSYIQKLLEDASSSSEPENSSYECNIVSPDNSFQPEIHIQAIITRLSNIVEETFEPLQEKAQHKYKEDFILPSPLRNYHHSKVCYNYGALQDIDGCTENSVGIIGNGLLAPYIKVNDVKDAICETVSTNFSEKGIQVAFENSVLLSDGRANLQVETEDNKMQKRIKKQHENKHTQTGILSLSTRRLAAYRKPLRGLPLMNNTPEPINNNSGKVFAILAKVPENISQVALRMTADRRFFCELCGKGYKKKSHLERHVRVHTGERPFPCPYCEKRFGVRSILKQHVRTHTGEKPYCCSLCSQRFPQKSGLMTHTMLHTGKPFKCDKCDKAFVSNHKLLQHLRSHSTRSGRKYPCSVCKTEFLTEGAMLQHKHIHNSQPIFSYHGFNNILFSK